MNGNRWLVRKNALGFTPQTIKGLEYRIVLAWQLYPAQTFADIDRRCTELGSAAKQPKHQAKRGTYRSAFNTDLSPIYIAYTRAMGMLLVFEPPTPANARLLDKLRPFADTELPQTDVVEETEQTTEAWRLEINKQLDVGNTSVAREIFEARDFGSSAAFDALRSSRAPVTVDSSSSSSSMPPKKPKAPPTEPSSPSRGDPSPKKQKEQVNPPPKKTKHRAPPQPAHPPPPPPADPIFKAQKMAKSLADDFSERRFLIVESLCNIELLLSSMVDVKGTQVSLFAFISQDPERTKIFYSCIANNLALLINIPFSKYPSASVEWNNLSRCRQEFLTFANLRSTKQHYQALHIYITLCSASDTELKKQGINRTDLEQYKSPPACVAAQMNRIDLLGILQQAGTNLDAATKNGLTPAFIAEKMGYVDMLHALKAWGANLNAPMVDGSTPAFVAAQEGRVEVLQALHELGVHLGAPIPNGGTLAYTAAQEGRVDVLRFLKELGVNLDTPAFNQTHPTYIAAQQGQDEALAVLIELGADINKPTPDGATPVLIATQTNHISALRILINKGADVNKPLHDKTMPLLVAIRKGSSKLVNILLTAKIDVDQSGPDGVTPLYFAAELGHEAIITLLLKAQAKVDQKTLDIAIRNGHTSILKQLKAAMEKQKKGDPSSPSSVGFFSQSPPDDAGSGPSRTGASPKKT